MTEVVEPKEEGVNYIFKYLIFRFTRLSNSLGLSKSIPISSSFCKHET